MFVKSFLSYIIIELSNNLIKYTQYKTVWSGLFTSVHCNRLVLLDRNEKLLKIFAYPSEKRTFYKQEMNL